MKFWLYMVTVILSLPKTIVFVVLGSSTSQNSKAAKWGKVVAIGVVVIITRKLCRVSKYAVGFGLTNYSPVVFASIWIRKKMAIATEMIEAERGITHDDDEQVGDEELGMLGPRIDASATHDTSYSGAAGPAPYGYQDAAGPASHERY
jgi:hypothetical protein